MIAPGEQLIGLMVHEVAFTWGPAHWAWTLQKTCQSYLFSDLNHLPLMNHRGITNLHHHAEPLSNVL